MRGIVGDLVYPFSALVGQDRMRLALVLGAIDPGLGGVLIRGSKGSAKSTAVRALATLLPEIEVYEHDPFHRTVDEDIPGAPLESDSKLVHRPAILVNLPMGATDDRVVGSLNLERALKSGERAFEPGLLAQAHRGILYIDEVNLLDDHLVDLLLDVAAMGVNHVERDGLAFRHPARFLLVGTMNPEEGDLRPQLLDRFGLAVEVEQMLEPSRRAEIVRRRLAFDANPRAFQAEWRDRDLAERERIAKARQLLPQVVVPDELVDAICSLCVAEGADGLRADLTIHKAASALAAYQGRRLVTHVDVKTVADLALMHRRTKRGPDDPSPSPPPESREGSNGSQRRPPRYELAGDESRAPGSRDEAGAGGEFEPEGAGSDGDDEVQESVETRSVRWSRSDCRRPGPRMQAATVMRSSTQGRGSLEGLPTGVFRRAEEYRRGRLDLALAATLRAAAPFQRQRGRNNGDGLIIHRNDLRVKVRASDPRRLVLFVVDASRSMGARRRMSETKGAILSLLVDSHQARDRVALIVFRQTRARLILQPTRSVRVAARRLEELPVGGATPLPHALELASEVLVHTARRSPGLAQLVVLITDGRGNVPLVEGNDPAIEALSLARRLGELGVSGLVIDAEGGPVRLGWAGRLAEAWGSRARLLMLDRLDGPELSRSVKEALFGRAG